MKYAIMMQEVVDVAGIFSWEVTMVRLIKGESDLATLHPDLVKEWHPIKNGDLMPEDISSGSGKEVWWLCPEGHTYSMVVNQRTKRGYGCPYCSGHRAIRGINDLATTNPELSEEWNYEKNYNLTPYDVTAGSHKKVWWLCGKGHPYEQFIIKRANRGYSCPYCSGHKVLRDFNDLATLNPLLAKEWHPTKNGDVTPYDVTTGSGKKAWWLCPLGHEYTATIRDRNSDNTQCPICNSKSQTSFPEQAIFFYVKTLYPDAINRYPRKIRDVLELLLCICRLKAEDPSILDCNEQRTKLLVKQLKKIDSDIRKMGEDGRLKHSFNSRLGITAPEAYSRVNPVIYALIETLSGGEQVSLIGFSDEEDDD